MNILTDPVFTLPGADCASLPAALARMARGDVPSFPGLRPHQRPAWHMFLVQLSALALSRTGQSAPPTEERVWLDALSRLTAETGGRAAWELVGEAPEQPAFMQPPDPGGLKWTDVPTPDSLDMLITARNHDLKRAVAKDASPEAWVFALVSLQTCEGYGGRGNHGVARMNGGASSRPMLGLVPKLGDDICVAASAHWRRDVCRLLADRAAGGSPGPGTPGRHGLLWPLPWKERDKLELRSMDPWCIEVCRRVRLQERDGQLSARCANSAVPRTNAKAFKGNVGDPWAPVHTSEGKSLTISAKGFDYRRLCDLLRGGDWTMPPLAKAEADDKGDMLLLAEAISRGNNKTDGFKSRVMPVPGHALPFLSSPTLGTVADTQLQEVAGFDKALRNGLALIVAGGQRDALERSHYQHTNRARAHFDRLADQLFFPSLWRRLSSMEGEQASADARLDFLGDLKCKADRVLRDFLPEMPCPSMFRARAEVRAQAYYERTLRTDGACRSLFDKESADAS